jgi:hypothetical protein
VSAARDFLSFMRQPDSLQLLAEFGFTVKPN